MQLCYPEENYCDGFAWGFDSDHNLNTASADAEYSDLDAGAQPDTKHNENEVTTAAPLMIVALVLAILALVGVVGLAAFVFLKQD